MCSDRIYSFPHFFFTWQACRSRGWHPQILVDHLTLSQGGQIIPTTLLLAPSPRILRPSYGPLEGRWDGGLTIGSPSPSLISILRPTHRSTVIEIFLSSLKHFAILFFWLKKVVVPLSTNYQNPIDIFFSRPHLKTSEAYNCLFKIMWTNWRLKRENALLSKID